MSKPELVLIPTPGRGHLVSTIEFAKLILKNDQHISILVIIFQMPIYNSATINTYIESQSNQVDTNRITFLTLPSLSITPDPASSSFFSDIVELQKPLIREAISARSTKPTAFVLDLMCVNFIDIANEFQVPCYIYFTAGASFLSLMFYLQERFDSKGVSIANEFSSSDDVKFDLPGFKNLVPGNALPLLVFDKDSGRTTFLEDLARRFRETKGILVNTFMELEPAIIQSLHRHENIPTVYPIGPVLALEEDDSRDGSSIMQWLDEQPTSSVVFLCFGSMGSFEAEQVKEIATGLDRSGYRFLWSLRKPLTEKNYVLPSDNGTFEEALPEGFLNRTANRGKIIGWAPQAQVLAHGAIGGFVSHCGWNSILEGMWFGVPIATWPMYSEQQFNAFELVKECELAVEIRMDYQRNLKKKDANMVVTADEVENGVKKLMNMDEEMMGRIQGMRNHSMKVLQCGGSSHCSLTKFITQVLQSGSIS